MRNDDASLLAKDSSSAKFQEHISFKQIFILILLFFAGFCEMYILFTSIFSILPSDIIFSKGYSNKFLREVLSCLNLSYSNYIIDNDSRQKEREKIQNFVQSVAQLQNYNPKKPYRNYHRYIGPWLEDDWCTVFKELPIQEFGVFVPIFVPWYYAFQQYRKSFRYVEFLNGLISLLDPKFLYFTVSSNDYGAAAHPRFLKKFPPNFFEANQGGTGTMPLPQHLKGRQPDINRNVSQIKYDLLFMGRISTNIQRSFIVNALFNTTSTRFYFAKAKNWMQMYPQSKTILCPRGLGRNTYRLTETLQLGYIPIVLYDDFLWLPYYDSINWSKIGLIARIDLANNVSELDKVVDFANSLTIEKVKEMSQYIISLHDTHFTYSATKNQIQLFLKYGFSRSDLRCNRV